ncbi:MAG: hypothetical protein K1X85_01525 [Ignavibacteria bacterium]|nr:hypothetical protein [Ignavibacteria bacterium]
MDYVIQKNYIAVIGGLNLDIKGVADSGGTEADSHQGRVRISPGGVARNIAQNLSQLGHRVMLFGFTGNDEPGSWITKATADAGVDVSNVVSADGVRTSAYVSVAGRTRELIYAVNDTQETAGLITEGFIRKNCDKLKNARMIVTDANLNEDALNAIITIANSNSVPVFADAVSAVKADRLSNLKGMTDLLSVNRAEFSRLFGDDMFTGEEIVSGAKKIAHKFGVIIRKKDKDGIDLIITESGKSESFTAPDAEVAEPNGAGDAFNAGFIHSYLTGTHEEQDLRHAVRCGMCASLFALATDDSVSSLLTSASLNESIRKHFQ